MLEFLAGWFTVRTANRFHNETLAAIRRAGQPTAVAASSHSIDHNLGGYTLPETPESIPPFHTV